MIKKIIYIANVRLPTEKAHGNQIVKMCEAFARWGREVALIIPRRVNPIREDVFSFYGIDPVFSIRRLWSLDLLPFWFVPKFLAFFLQQATFSFSVAIRYLFADGGIFFCRDPFSAFLLSLWHRRVFFEIHDFYSRRGLYRIFFSRLAGIISTNRLKADRLREDFQGKQLPVLVAFNGVDIEMFSRGYSKQEARKRLRLPQEKYIILYTGHLYDWKGAYVLLEAAKQFSIFNDQFSKNADFMFVGGTDEDIADFRKKAEGYDNVKVAGRKPHKEIPLWIWAADVLVLPNSNKSRISLYDTSPLKLFEYLAGRRPVVASRLPALEEVLTDRKTCLFFEPDNPEDLARKIKELVGDRALGEKLAAEGYKVAQANSLEARAKSVVSFIDGNT